MNALILAVPEPDLRQICAYVYVKGNAQKPMWMPAKRAKVLTAKLRQAQAHEQEGESSSNQQEKPYAVA
ncbi:MAG: hypothetical protein NTY53_23155 [Kiritimatiellaeota bacterium]|nr:hypothetical protein [Kiritimatiellota bacterium]